MKQQFQLLADYIKQNKNEFIIGSSIVAGLIIITITITLLIKNSTSVVAYQPVSACDLLTIDEAKSLLGPNAINSNTNTPVQTADTAASRCGYTNGTTDTENLVVAAIIVRSGINDKGVEKNATDFSASRPTQNVDNVKDLGDSAYFNKTLGQLNILDGNEWIILSYGIGSAPEANTVEDAIDLALMTIQPTAIKNLSF